MYLSPIIVNSPQLNARSVGYTVFLKIIDTDAKSKICTC